MVKDWFIHNLLKSLPVYAAIEPKLDFYGFTINNPFGEVDDATEAWYRAVKEGTHIFVETPENFMQFLSLVSLIVLRTTRLCESFSANLEVFNGVEDTGLQSTFFSGDSEVFNFYYRRILLFGA